jgi:fructose-1,6-bisphosphatase I
MIYSFNEGNMDLWDNNVREYIQSLKQPEKWGGKPYTVSVALRCSQHALT